MAVRCGEYLPGMRLAGSYVEGFEKRDDHDTEHDGQE